MKDRNVDLFKRRNHGNPHDHPVRKVFQRRAEMDFDSLELAKRIVAETKAEGSPTARPAMTDDERQRFRHTLHALEFTTQVEMLLRGAVALYMARMNPDDRTMAYDELLDVQAEVSQRLARFRDERHGAVALAERVDAMFGREPMPELQEYLDGVLERTLGAAPEADDKH